VGVEVGDCVLIVFLESSMAFNGNLSWFATSSYDLIALDPLVQYWNLQVQTNIQFKCANSVEA